MNRGIYAAPWREPLVRPGHDVELVEYGPTLATLIRQHAAFRDWAWRPPARTAGGGDQLRAFMRPGGGALRDDASPRELGCYLAVHERGKSLAWTAQALGISRASVQVYLRRLRRKAARHEASRAAGGADPGARADPGAGRRVDRAA